MTSLEWKYFWGPRNKKQICNDSWVGAKFNKKYADSLTLKRKKTVHVPHGYLPTAFESISAAWDNVGDPSASPHHNKRSIPFLIPHLNRLAWMWEKHDNQQTKYKLIFVDHWTMNETVKIMETVLHIPLTAWAQAYKKGRPQTPPNKSGPPAWKENSSPLTLNRAYDIISVFDHFFKKLAGSFQFLLITFQPLSKIWTICIAVAKLQRRMPHCPCSSRAAH